MISLAIALVLILGIEQVFSITSKTVGAGQALSTANRDDRALHTILSSDFQNAVTTSDNPFFVIRSGRTYAFSTAADKAAAMDPANPQLDPAYANYTPANTIPTTDYNYRNHRIDRVGVCERGLFQRQTGGNDTTSTPSANVAQQFLSTTTSNEAFVWLGHLAIPNNAYVAWQATNPTAGTAPPSGANFYEPGDLVAANNNNFYANDWILGRCCQLLVPAQTNDNSYIDIVTGAGRGLTPLTAASTSFDTFSTLFQSRYDQVRTSIADFDGALQTYSPGTSSYTAVDSTGASNTKDWYQQIFGGPVALATSPIATNRFQANPFVSKPLTNSRLAKVAPIFVRSCTQFIVEYAGDYVAQDSTGAIDNTKPAGGDGVLDYQIVNGQRQIRWYGFPRHTSGNTSNTITIASDVVPLAALLQTATPPRTAPTFERFYPSTFMPNSVIADYGAGSNTPANAEYLAAWGNTDTVELLPRMIRITIGIDDPNGNLNNAQMYEYIFNLGQ